MSFYQSVRSGSHASEISEKDHISTPVKPLTIRKGCRQLYALIRQSKDDGTLTQVMLSQLAGNDLKSKRDQLRRIQKKQRSEFMSNIRERAVDVVFEGSVQVRVYKAMLKQREAIESKIKAEEKQMLLCSQRQSKMFLRNDEQGEKLYDSRQSYISRDDQNEQSYEDQNFEEVQKYLEYQSSQNLLDRVEKREMQVFASEQYRSSSITEKIPKLIFPFEQFVPAYTEQILSQLEETPFTEIGEELSSSISILAFTQLEDRLFGTLLSNGLIQVRDVFSGSQYEVNHHLHNKRRGYTSRVFEIVGVRLLPDEQSIIAWHSNGAVSMYDYIQDKQIFYIDNFFKHSSSVLKQAAGEPRRLCITSFEVISQNSESSEVICIVANARGDCVLAKISRGFWDYSADIIYISQGEFLPVTQIVQLSKEFQKQHFSSKHKNNEGKEYAKHSIVAIVSPSCLLIVKVKLRKMKVVTLLSHTEQSNCLALNPQASFAWGEINLKENTPSLIFLVSFTQSLHIGQLIKSNTHEETQRIQKENDSASSSSSQEEESTRMMTTFDISKRVRHYTSILFVGGLYSHIFAVCDFNMKVFLINAKDMQRCYYQSITLSNMVVFKTNLNDMGRRIVSLELFFSEEQKRQQESARNSARERKGSTNILQRKMTDNEAQLTDEKVEDKEVTNEMESVDIYVEPTMKAVANSVSFSIISQRCYILYENQGIERHASTGVSQLFCVSLTPWRKTLDQLLARHEYLNAMHFLHQVYTGQHKYAHSSLQRVQLKHLIAPQIERASLNFLDRLVRGQSCQQLPEIFDEESESDTESSSAQFLDAVTCDASIEMKESPSPTLKKSSSAKKSLLMFVIEFLLSCDQLDYVFFEMHDICQKELKSNSFFVQAIEPFISERKISVVPNELLTEIIQFYEESRNSRMIQQILTSLDVFNLDTKPLIQLTLEKKLVPAMIYLSTRQQSPDFVTPLMSLWHSFATELRDWESRQRYGRQKSFQFDSTTDALLSDRSGPATLNDALNSEELVKETALFVNEQSRLHQNSSDLTKISMDFTGLRTLWYFRMCIQQRLIDDEFIKEEDFCSLVLFFEVWLGEAENIRIALHRWPIVFFDVLRVFFSDKVLKILDNDQRKIDQAAESFNNDAKNARNLKNPFFIASREYLANSLNKLPSSCLLLQVIQATLEVEQAFEISIQMLNSVDPSQRKRNINWRNYTQEEIDITPMVDSFGIFRDTLDDFYDCHNIGLQLEERKESLLASFNLFLAHIVYQSQCRDDSNDFGGKLSLKTSKVIDIVFYLTKKHKTVLMLEFSKDQLFQAVKQYSVRWGQAEMNSVPEQLKASNYKELAGLLRSEFVLALVRHVYPIMNALQQTQISQNLDATEFATAQSHVLLLREQYQRAIDSYIASNNATMSRLVFEAMANNLKESQAENEQKFSVLKEIMRKRLPDFIKIDPESTHILFQQFIGNDAENDIISNLSENPALQFIYIQNIVKQHKIDLLVEQEEQTIKVKIDPLIPVRQIALMCELNHKEEDILTEILNFEFYPLKEILLIVTEKNYMEVCSYIHLRMGMPDQAIRAQMRILDRILREYRNCLEEYWFQTTGLSPAGRFMSLGLMVGGVSQSKTTKTNKGIMTEQILNVLQQGSDDDKESSLDVQGSHAEKIVWYNGQVDKTISKLFSICYGSKAHEKPTESWFLLLDLLVEVWKKHEDTEVSELLVPMLAKYQQIIGLCIKEMASRVQMDDFVLKMRDSENKLNLIELKQTFIDILNENIDSGALLFRNFSFIQEDILAITQTAAEKFLRATASSGFCSACLEPLSSIEQMKKKMMHKAVLKKNKGKGKVNGKANENEDEDLDDDDDDDSDDNSIVSFLCGHTYHKECHYRQHKAKVCTECLDEQNSLFSLMTQRQDINLPALIQFIETQQKQFLEETEEAVPTKETSEINNTFTRQATIPKADAGKSQQQPANSEKQNEKDARDYKKVKALGKLKNFDKQVSAKYSEIQLIQEKPTIKKRKIKS